MAKNNRTSHTLTKSELWLGWAYLLFELFLLPTLLVMANSAANYPLGSAYINFIYFCINFVAVLVIFRRLLGHSVIHLGSNFPRCLKAAFLGFCVYYVTTLAMNNLIEFLYPGFANINDSNVASMARLDYVPMVIGTVILVPITEEVLFRGLVFRPFYAQNRILGYVLSTVIFCGIHIMGYIGSAEPLTLILCFIQYIPASLCLAWAYAESDNIFAPILIHTAVNLMGILAL